MIKVAAIAGALGLLVGAMAGWRLHPKPQVSKVSERDVKSTTGPITTEIDEYATCPVCALCAGQAPTPRPAAIRASNALPGASVGLPEAVRVALAHAGERQASTQPFDPPSQPDQLPHLVRRILVTQGESTSETKSSNSTVVSQPVLPNWLLGAEIIDPLTGRTLLLRGGYRLFGELWITGSVVPASKDYALGAEVHF